MKALIYLMVNNLVFGAIVIILGVGVSLYEFYHRETLGEMEHVPKKSA